MPCVTEECLGLDVGEVLLGAEGEVSEKARLFLRVGVVSTALTLDVLVWPDRRGDGRFRLDRLVMFVARASGASILLELLETSRVWRLGELNEVVRDGALPFMGFPRDGLRDILAAFEGSFSEEFLEVISSLSGDAARCWIFVVCPLRCA